MATAFRYLGTRTIHSKAIGSFTGSWSPHQRSRPRLGAAVHRAPKYLPGYRGRGREDTASSSQLQLSSPSSRPHHHRRRRSPLSATRQASLMPQASKLHSPWTLPTSPRPYRTAHSHLHASRHVVLDASLPDLGSKPAVCASQPQLPLQLHLQPHQSCCHSRCLAPSCFVDRLSVPGPLPCESSFQFQQSFPRHASLHCRSAIPDRNPSTYSS